MGFIICEDTRGTNASCSAFNMSFRTFSAADAKGGTEVVLSKTAILFIEYQNEFTSEGGKLHNAVKPCMDETGMLEKSSALASKARDSGVNIFHAPIMFKDDASDNPNKALGILAGCANDKLFTEGTWNPSSTRPCSRWKGTSWSPTRRGWTPSLAQILRRSWLQTE